MTGGFLGELFASLSFAGALVAAISFFMASQGLEEERGIWKKMGSGAWFCISLAYWVLLRRFSILFTLTNISTITFGATRLTSCLFTI